MDLLGGYGSDESDKSSESGCRGGALLQSTSAPSLNQAPAPISKRGKKLIALHAVLPAHILERLTKEGGDDSDDDEPTSAPLVESKPSNPASRGKDAGLTSLLSELGSIPKRAASCDESNAEPTFQPERMGHAFLQVKTSVWSKAKQTEIVDVHTPDVETVGESQAMDEVTRQKPSTLSSLILPAATRQWHGNLPTSPPELGLQQPTATYVSTNGPSDGYSTVSDPFDQIEQMDGNMEPRLTKKRSRREIEKALRSGDLDSVGDSVNLYTIDGVSNVYTPEQEAFTTQKGSGVRIAPVAMYDTKAGKDVLGASVSGKAKGKNQINYLMVSAAAFEANEAQKTKVKTQRANAKRKYGW